MAERASSVRLDKRRPRPVRRPHENPPWGGDGQGGIRTVPSRSRGAWRTARPDRSLKSTQTRSPSGRDGGAGAGIGSTAGAGGGGAQGTPNRGGPPEGVEPAAETHPLLPRVERSAAL